MVCRHCKTSFEVDSNWYFCPFCGMIIPNTCKESLGEKVIEALEEILHKTIQERINEND